MPTGLGWFVTNESGQRLVWTFGHIPDAGSALIVKMTKPAIAGSAEKRLTLIMLANSGGLAKGYDLENAQRHLVAVRESISAALHLSLAAGLALALA